jgi:ribonuclease P protein component
LSEEANSSRLKIPKSRRLRSSLDFAETYALKHKAGNAYLLIFAARNEIGSTRIGLSVSKKNGNSVVRHRIRRLLKEAYRLEQHAVPEGLDLILIPRPNSGATIDDYRNAIVYLSNKLQQRIPQES